MKRKGERYLGGNTIITLHPRLVEEGLAAQALDYQRQVQDSQQQFDQRREQEIATMNEIDHLTRSPNRRARQNAEKFYKDQVNQIERQLMTKPHPRILASLLSQQIELLGKLLVTTNQKERAKQKIRRRIFVTQRRLEWLQNE